MHPQVVGELVKMTVDAGEQVPGGHRGAAGRLAGTAARAAGTKLGTTDHGVLPAGRPLRTATSLLTAMTWRSARPRRIRVPRCATVVRTPLTGP